LVHGLQTATSISIKTKQLQTTVLGTWPNTVKGCDKGRLKFPRFAQVLFPNKK